MRFLSPASSFKPASLTRDTAEAAAAIRLITGPISIREEKIAGRSRGARWIASFQPQWNEILSHITNNGPDSAIKGAGLANARVEVPIEKIPQYVALADKFKLLQGQGSSINAIASAHGMSWKQATDILHFANTGERPKSQSRKRTGQGQRKIYVEIAAKVVEMRDQNISFTRIAAELKVSHGTVTRAYDYARPESVRAAAEDATKVVRGKYSHLSAETFAKIRQRILEGEKDRQIAEEVGCTSSTVARFRKKMQSDEGLNKAG